ncbi:hypothetical protein ORI89_17660 [Sphingobacterium sp. UT-1RO-CII-1]|uniref:hypothetical protein n=1 Tax=Sphingobacterium sp. UT-1RO-CII-1 TaxID=2995225 RepID=UPI00227C7DFE|nr:hypothetical protein [Sphingobacterium sp. UT-1RO-CII-1]MCY4781487.1 hypothetical protein [Sphingobacterium sp. UT-1RO-CII-1]
MKKSKKLWWIAAGLSVILLYGIWEAFNQPSIKDLPGDFKETAFVRNEQNKGGIIRIYAVSVGDIQNANYEACADLFPTNDYGSITKIYFFDKKKGFPKELSLEAPHYDTNRYEAIMILKRTGNEK